jgi:hypothetical protein
LVENRIESPEERKWAKRGVINFDAFAKAQEMAKQKFRPTRLGGFSGAKGRGPEKTP